MLPSKMAANMAAKTGKHIYTGSQVSYNYTVSVDLNSFKVRESIYRSGNSLGMLPSNMAANMAAKTEKYVYTGSQVSYNYTVSVDFNSFKVRKSIYRSGNRLGMLRHSLFFCYATEKTMCKRNSCEKMNIQNIIRHHHYCHCCLRDRHIVPLHYRRDYRRCYIHTFLCMAGC